MLIIGDTCEFYAFPIGCPQPSCSCRNLFSATCGSFNGSITIFTEPQSVQYVASWLAVLGVANIQTLFGQLTLALKLPMLQWSRPRPLSQDSHGNSLISWSIDIFPNLVVSGGVSVTTMDIVPGGPVDTTWQPIVVLPGPGLARLRAGGVVTVSADADQVILNTDVAFLSSLECVGSIHLEGLPALRSLRGLAGVSDSPIPVPSEFFVCGVAVICFEFSDSPLLSDFSALATYARCGRPDQRSDYPKSLSYPSTQNVAPGVTINSWTDLCTCIRNLKCASGISASPPQPPPPVPPPPTLRLSPPRPPPSPSPVAPPQQSPPPSSPLRQPPPPSPVRLLRLFAPFHACTSWCHVSLQSSESESAFDIGLVASGESSTSCFPLPATASLSPTPADVIFLGDLAPSFVARMS